MTNEEKRTEVLRTVLNDFSDNSFCFVGSHAFCKLKNGNNVKVTCNDHGFVCDIINRTGGKVDMVELSFSLYFAPVQTSPKSPLFYPCIDGGKWYFDQYPNCIPTANDFKCLGEAVDKVIFLYT